MLLSASFEKVENMLTEMCDGDTQEDSRRTLRLPTADGNNLLSYTSGGWDNVPAKLRSCSAAEEMDAVTAIITEIRDKMAVDLDVNPIINRWPEVAAAHSDTSQKSFLVIGSSHAGKLGSALRKQGHHADVIYEANRQATKDDVIGMEEAIIQKLDVMRINTVILCILDNNIYYAVSENGDISPAKKDKNGVYQMEGNLFTSIRPLLDAARGRNVCCEDVTHFSNRRMGSFEANLLRDLKDIAENLRDFLFTSRYKQYKVLDPAVSWRNKDNSYLWGEDPVHPSEAAYCLLADSALHICTIMESSARKRAWTNSIETGLPGPSTALNRQQGGRGARSAAGRGTSGHYGGPRADGSGAGRRGGYGQRRGN
jgi:hypothetical protein